MSINDHQLIFPQMCMYKDASYKLGKGEPPVMSFSSMFSTTLLRTGTKCW